MCTHECFQEHNVHSQGLTVSVGYFIMYTEYNVTHNSFKLKSSHLGNVQTHLIVTLMLCIHTLCIINTINNIDLTVIVHEDLWRVCETTFRV